MIKVNSLQTEITNRNTDIFVILIFDTKYNLKMDVHSVLHLREFCRQDKHHVVPSNGLCSAAESQLRTIQKVY